MRDIKFRCWDTYNKEMLGVDYLHFDEFTKEVDVRTDMYSDYFSTKDMILMQYTGLKDKNGKEIYEGDIVKFNYGYHSKKVFAPVKYGEWEQSKCDEYDCVHYGYYVDYKWENYCENTGVDLYEINEIVEVIGNIYDNPELLEVD